MSAMAVVAEGEYVKVEMQLRSAEGGIGLLATYVLKRRRASPRG